ncbi:MULTISPECIES: flagellar hook-associated protein FlgK [unclassified Paenibacillus]|uniref:flagellar hook-associated protein FlgK n=1 Tax=unclassified Paenibacillus TaxID=185978 RepID=UPI001AE5727E|nr:MULTISPECIES: flagellar hook-associated protein FlgK [unclassified Paenibacillus]MBP1157806.1 flagellar hook-associated protein 1 FlgK [Paenibacillus sp. PvP091]MBP1171458.1 flagellar hook-associated protein 1 FlgK [Paenibacillus sp. PvR098]MBP2442486.1 flagellar hook-associated protein 1 FlgK [Paenibacillus sp. PvP052]
MRSTFGGIEIAKRSLFTQQAALTTTGHNIANANTKGYSRQVVNMVASRPIEYPGLMRSNVPGQMGQGVEFDQIKRVREGFLDNQFHNENKALGEWSIRKDTLDKLEAIINEPSDTGIRQTIEGFWNAWQELSKSPENTTARVLVKERALAMTDAFNHTARQLKELSGDLTESVSIKTNEVNTILSQVAKLNEEIYRIEGLGNSANDLRDQRDLLVDNLSSIINISYTEEANGYNIQMGNVQLVAGRQVATVFTRESLEAHVATGNLNSGEVYGMLQSRDYNVANYQFQLDSMLKVLVQGDVQVTLPKDAVIPAGTTLTVVNPDGTTQPRTFGTTIAERTLTEDLPVIVKGFNGLHELGYSGSSPLTSGIPFFSLKPGTTEFSAENVTVNATVLNDVSNISSSLRTYMDTDGTEKVVKGNNDMALLLAGIRGKRVSFEPSPTGRPILTDGTFDEFFRSMVGELGVQSQEAARQATNQQILVDQVDSRRQAVSGVSLDEEMVNMIKFQHAYNAAARSLTTFDEMLDKVINGMGVVGR